MVQWNTHIYSDSTASGARSMQVWIGVNGTEDISYAYGADTIGQDAPADGGVTIGAENVTGDRWSSGRARRHRRLRRDLDARDTRASRRRCRSPSGAYSKGARSLTSTMVSDQVAGATTVTTPITVVKRSGSSVSRFE